MLNWLKENTAKARAGMAAEVSKFKNRVFMEAVVAGCALVAAADGDVSADEKQKMAGYIRSADELKHFDMGEVIKAFEETVQKFEFDNEIGKAEALKTIGKLRGKPDQARLLVRVTCAIGAADGDFDPDEKKMVAQIARDLDLDSAEFDLV